MMEPALPAAVSAAACDAVWCQHAAEDLRMLGWLHGRERDGAVLQQLYLAGFPAGLVLLSAHDASAAAHIEQMGRILAATCTLTPAELAQLNEELAVDYTAIYLTHAHRTSPHESVWLDDDQLMLQEPTFAVREFYRHHGLQVHNWREMPDDHLCNELEFVALMLEQGKLQAALGFMQQHLMQWVPALAQRVAERAHTSFYATLALITLAACRACESMLLNAGVQPEKVEAAAASCIAGAAPAC